MKIMELWGADFGVFDRLKLQFRVKDFVCIYFFSFGFMLRVVRLFFIEFFFLYFVFFFIFCFVCWFSKNKQFWRKEKEMKNKVMNILNIFSCLVAVVDAKLCVLFGVLTIRGNRLVGFESG